MGSEMCIRDSTRIDVERQGLRDGLEIIAVDVALIFRLEEEEVRKDERVLDEVRIA